MRTALVAACSAVIGVLIAVVAFEIIVGQKQRAAHELSRLWPYVEDDDGVQPVDPHLLPR